MMSPIISLFLTAIVEPNLSIGFEIFVIFWPIMVTYAIFVPTIMLQLFYLIFGSEFFLWSFVDELLLFVFVAVVPNLTFFVSVVSAFVGLAFSSDGQSSYIGDDWHIITIIYVLQAVLYNRYTYKTLPDAIRYVKPEWDFVGEGQPLYPTPFYLLGIERHPDGKE